MSDMSRDAILCASRLLLCALFVVSGLGKLADPAGIAGALTGKGFPAAEVLAQTVGLFEVAAGLALALGGATRIAAAALALFTVIATLLFHDFWSYAGDARGDQTTQFLKNLGLTGGFVLIAAFGAGRFSIDAALRERLHRRSVSKSHPSRA